ncbi:MAG: LysM peptidoglycan-binding domain-containing M23 family metallopeptidase [Acidobacteriota bacterium]|nr:LysM peptidoglycan-binding domain-containing M23 family metallopeptidase [Acidobacteriota bacterium]
MRPALIAWTLAAGLVATGCGTHRMAARAPVVEAPTPRGVIHVVRRGQTLWRIARTYGVPLEDIARANHLDDPRRLAAGQKLLIPGATRVLEVPPAQPASPAEPGPLVKDGWSWPLDGPLSSRFGVRRAHGRHQGIDITAPAGTAVRAARSGRVTFAGRRGRYGRLVVIEHAGGFSSWYAHNQSLAVHRGQEVERGQVIARSGQSGNATGPHLHFEIRRRGRPIDPSLLLP